MGTEGEGPLKKARGNFRAEVGEELGGVCEVARKIAEMAEEARRRLFGPQPKPERGTQPPFADSDVVEPIFIDGIRAIRSAQGEAATTLQDILNRL